MLTLVLYPIYGIRCGKRPLRPTYFYHCPLFRSSSVMSCIYIHFYYTTPVTVGFCGTISSMNSRCYLSRHSALIQEGNSMPRIQFGLSLPSPRRMSRQDYLASVQKSLELVTGHCDSVWFTDHLQYDDAPILEGWTILTYLAALHPQFTFGHVVLCQSLRNPALLAKMAATFQYMS